VSVRACVRLLCVRMRTCVILHVRMHVCDTLRVAGLNGRRGIFQSSTQTGHPPMLPWYQTSRVGEGFALCPACTSLRLSFRPQRSARAHSAPLLRCLQGKLAHTMASPKVQAYQWKPPTQAPGPDKSWLVCPTLYINTHTTKACAHTHVSMCPCIHVSMCPTLHINTHTQPKHARTHMCPCVHVIICPTLHINTHAHNQSMRAHTDTHNPFHYASLYTQQHRRAHLHMHAKTCSYLFLNEHANILTDSNLKRQGSLSPP